MINHVIYADDVHLVCLNNVLAQAMLDVCWKFGLERDLKWNSTKTKVIRLKSKNPNFATCNSPLSFPGQPSLEEVTNEKWIGYTLNFDMKDDLHASGQWRRLYAAAHQITANVSPRYLHFKTKRMLINAFGGIYLLGTLDRLSQKSMRKLSAAHTYLVKTITTMHIRGTYLKDLSNELIGVQELFELGTVADYRSRWAYAKYNVKNVRALQDISKYRLENTMRSIFGLPSPSLPEAGFAEMIAFLESEQYNIHHGFDQYLGKN